MNISNTFDATSLVWPLLVLFLMVVAWQIGKTLRARDSLDNGAYRELVEKAAESQLGTAEELKKVVAELSELSRRTGELERLLKDVA
jgi:hypothetical protein